MATRVMRIVTGLLIVLVAAASSGCVVSREISRTRHVVEQAFPGSEFDRKIVLSVGSFWMRTSSWILGMTDDAEANNASDYLSDIDRIKIGVYKTEVLPESGLTGTPMLRDLIEDGWEPAVQVGDEEGHVWVMYRARRNQIRDAFVIILDDEELVIARLDGHLDRLVQRAVRDHRPLRRFATGHQ